jgi:hypothetical protein
LENVVQQFNPILPILLDGVVFIHFLKFAKIRSEVFASHDLIQDDLFKLVIFNLDPKIILSLLVQILQQAVDLLQGLLLHLHNIILPIFIRLQDHLDQPLTLGAQVKLRLVIELGQNPPDPFKFLTVDLLTSDHTLHIKQEGYLNVV